MYFSDNYIQVRKGEYKLVRQEQFMAFQGVPPEALRLWGQSMVMLGSKLVIFGGYGGAGAHKRLHDVLVYDCPTGILRKLHVTGELPILCSEG